VFTSLSVYLCVLNQHWTSNKEYIFIHHGSKEGTAASTYCEKIRNWVTEKKDLILQFIRPERCNAHGIRKGSATDATANTAETSIASVFHRGEWSLGTILDIYWKFAQRGDQFLGRFLTGLDPDSQDFDVLPPHFMCTAEDDLVKQAMRVCFGKILDDQDENSFLYAVCYQCLPSLIYHETAIRKEISKTKYHPWRSLPIFQETDLLTKLKHIVTLEPTTGILEKPTGVGKFTKLYRAIETMKEAYNEEKRLKASFIKDVRDAVKDAIEAKALENGQLSYANFKSVLDEELKNHALSNNEKLEGAISKITALFNNNLRGGNDAVDTTTCTTTNNNDGSTSNENIGTNIFKTYSHCGNASKVYFVPEGYALPQMTSLMSAFRLFVNGDLGYNVNIGGQLINLPVRPFYFWTAATIPGSLWTKYKSGWQKVLKTMIGCADLGVLKTKIESQSGPSSNDEIVMYYSKGLAHVHSQVEYTKNKVTNWEKWSVTTWNKNINNNKILLNGSQADIDRLLPETHYNKRHKEKRKFKNSRQNNANV